MARRSLASLRLIPALGLTAALAIPHVSAARELEPIARSVRDITELLRREDAAIRGARGTPIFLPAGRGFLYQEDGRGGMRILRFDAAGRRERLARPDVLARALAAEGIASSDVLLEGAAGDLQTLYFQTTSGAVSFERRSGKARRAPERDAWLRLHRPRVLSDQLPQTYGDLLEAPSPDGRWFIAQHDDDLWLRDTKGGLRRLTDDGARNLTWGGTEESAQQLNAYWSADSRKIAAVRLDNRAVPMEPLASYLTPRTTIEQIPFSRVGEPISRFELYIIDVERGERVRIETGPTADHYVNLLGWNASGSSVYYQVVSRDQKTVEFRSADARTGVSTTLATERSQTYVDTPFSLGPALLTPLKASDGFLLFSERDGVRRLYRRQDASPTETPLGADIGLVSRIVSVDDKRGRVFVLAAAKDERPYDTALYSLPLDGGPAQRLTPGPGVREAWDAPDGPGFVVRTSDPQTPPQVAFVSGDGGQTVAVSVADASGLRAMGFSPPERFATTAVDGRLEVRGLILKPFGFDPARRYPVVEMIYGGMQVSHNRKSFYSFGDLGAGYNSVPARVLLHHGFVVVYVDAPGTPGRGRAYQDATYGAWPGGVIPNHAKWIRDASRTRPWMDLSRVGVFGSSWGGFLTQHALAEAPDLYKVGVSMAAVSDLSDHQMYIEPFMGRPADNPAGYAAASIYPRIKDIRGRILSIGFPRDINAGFSPTMKFVDAMVAADKDIDLFVMPAINHQVTCCDPHSATYAYAVITRYFRRLLGEGQAQ